jgi:Domain of unknown function (DUF4160)
MPGPAFTELNVGAPTRMAAPSWLRFYVSAVPTVMHINGLRVVIYPNDHPPAHVHVLGPGWVVVTNLIELEVARGAPPRRQHRARTASAAADHARSVRLVRGSGAARGSKGCAGIALQYSRHLHQTQTADAIGLF